MRRSLDGIGAYATYDYTVSFGNEAIRFVGSAVSPSVFALLDVSPARGRFFTPDEGETGAGPVVILSDRLWRDRYGADRAILGHVLTMIRSSVDDGEHRRRDPDSQREHAGDDCCRASLCSQRRTAWRRSSTNTEGLLSA